jgi:hypothetical protein
VEEHIDFPETQVEPVKQVDIELQKHIGELGWRRRQVKLGDPRKACRSPGTPCPRFDGARAFPRQFRQVPKLTEIVAVVAAGRILALLER